MSEENVFDENVDYLVEALSVVSKKDKLLEQSDALKTKEKRLKKAVSVEEKSIADEINSTIKKRKNEIAESFDKQIDANQNKIKGFNSKRDKKKNKKIGERIETETFEVREENRKLTTELKTLFKQNKVPSFCLTTAYYSLFMPRGFSEVLTFLLTFIVSIAGIPYGIYNLMKYVIVKDIENGNIYTTIACCGVIIVLFSIYFLVFNCTKLKHKEAIIEGRKIKDKIKANKKKIKATKNAINKDKDESGYDLDKYDETLRKLENECERIGKEKQDALNVFETKTKSVIIAEINDRRKAHLDEIKEEYKNTEEAIEENDVEISDISIAITQQYEAFLGKDFVQVGKLKELIDIMKNKEALTVSEAISVYKEH